LVATTRRSKVKNAEKKTTLPRLFLSPTKSQDNLTKFQPVRTLFLISFLIKSCSTFPMCVCVFQSTTNARLGTTAVNTFVSIRSADIAASARSDTNSIRTAEHAKVIARPHAKLCRTSVPLSVYQSVTLRYCVETVKPIVEVLPPPSNNIIVHCVQKKTPTHVIFYISMSDV